MAERPTRQDMLPLTFASSEELLSSGPMSNVRSPRTQFQFVDLFAGVGGFHHALSALGGECVLAVELDPECRRVYSASFPEMSDEQIKDDIRGLTRAGSSPEADELSPEEIRDRVPKHDVLCAGFPCQPFSKSGFQKGTRDKTRGTLFFDVMSIVLAREPEYVILENVRNLAGPRHLDTWETIVESLREAGYRVADEPVVLTPHLLHPDEGGAPQVRDRVFVLARRLPPAMDEEQRRGQPLAVREPSPGWDPHRWDIGKLLEHDVDLDEYGLRKVEEGWLAAWQDFVRGIKDDHLPGFPIWSDAFQSDIDIAAGTPRWKSDFLRKNSEFYVRHRDFIDEWRQKEWGPLNQVIEDFPASRRKFEWQARRSQPTARSRDLEGLVAHFRPSGIRVKPASYLPALVAITQTSVLGPKVTGTGWRRLTPREAAKLQGIPFDGFARAGVADKAIYRQLGNAVNVGVVRHVAEALFVDGKMRSMRATERVAG
jgi:DNA (cytosine-5)-methyltransferase 1